MNIDALRYFAAAYEQGGIHKAAKVVHISPQGLSRSIKQLEDAMLTPLFDRTRQGLAPTLVADQLYVYAKRVLDASTDLDEFVQRCKRCEMGKLTLAVCGGFNRLTHEVPAIIGLFQREHEDVQCVIEYAVNAESVYGMLGTGEVDVGIFSYANERDGFDYLPIKTSRVGCLLAKENPLAQKGTISWKDIGGLPLFGADRNDPFSLEVAANFKAHGLEMPKMVYSTDLGVVSSAIAQGRAMGIFSQTYIKEVMRYAQDLAFVEIDPPLYMKVGFIMRPANAKHDRILEFVRFIAQRMA